MCRESPAGAPLAGTESEELLKAVDAGLVTIAPVHSESIGADQLERKRTYVGRNSCGIEKRAAAHFFDACGTRARQPEGPSRKEPLVPLLVPLDEYAVVAAVDGVGDGVHGGYWLLAISYWLLAIGYWLLAIGEAYDLLRNKKPS
jgi:hypothetical protein